MYKDFLVNLKDGLPQRSVFYYGAKSIDRTILLHQIEQIAEQLRLFHCYIDAATTKFFTKQLLAQIKSHFQNNCIAKISKHTGNYSDIEPVDLVEGLVLYGQAAAQISQGICILIDKMQNLQPQDLKNLTMAVHRCNQLRLPVLLFGTGDSMFLKNLGKTCSYAERLFSYEELNINLQRDEKNEFQNP